MSSDPVTPSAAASGRGDAGFRSASRVHGLGHRIRAKRLLQARGESGDRRERVGEALCVEAEHLGCGARRAKTADGAGVVPVPVVSAAHGLGDARGDLVADDHRAQKRLARDLPRLGDCERRGDGRGAGMIDALAEDVVHLDGVRRRAVDERGRAHARAPAEREPGFAMVELSGESALEQEGRRNHAARKQRRVPVDHGALRLVQHLRRHRLPAIALGEPGETFDDVHSSLS